MATKAKSDYKYPNYYETLDEAHRRLLGTVVMYDNEPGTLVAITNHKSDGIYRAYFWPCSNKHKLPPGLDLSFHAPGNTAQGAYIDEFIAANKDCGLLRKQLNSPSFNKFRPFALGMMNYGGAANYLERTPERRTYQGLTRTAIFATSVSLDPTKRKKECPVHLFGSEFTDCVKAAHPKADEVLENMLSPDNANSSVACHRDFAIIRGPLDTFYLGHKDKVVGFIPPTVRPEVELGKGFSYLRETVEEMGQFKSIRTRG